MQITNVLEAGANRHFKWPSGETESYDTWIKYKAIAEDGEHDVVIGFGKRTVYSRERSRISIWIDEVSYVQFFGADDFEVSGDVLSEIRVHTNDGERICRYRSDPIPERYTSFNTVGLPVRVDAKGVHQAWAVVANISD